MRSEEKQIPGSFSIMSIKSELLRNPINLYSLILKHTQVKCFYYCSMYVYFYIYVFVDNFCILYCLLVIGYWSIYCISRSHNKFINLYSLILKHTQNLRNLTWYRNPTQDQIRLQGRLKVTEVKVKELQKMACKAKMTPRQKLSLKPQRTLLNKTVAGAPVALEQPQHKAEVGRKKF